MPSPLIIGTHTRTICNRLDRAIEDYRRGVSTFLVFLVPRQHGKSDIVSRALPAYFLGHCADREPSIIMTAYNAELAQGFSKDAKRIMASDSYGEVFPGVRVAHGSDNIRKWAVDGSAGRALFDGLGGTVAGNRGDLIILDDYCRGLAEARSKVLRDKWWGAFSADLMPARATPCIACVTSTPWNIDDVVGRIQAKMAKNQDYFRFEILRFPAKNRDEDGEWDGTYLFPALKGEDWYVNEYSEHGRLAAAILDMEPVLEGGNRFNMDGVRIHDSVGDFPATRYVRAWDLASSAKERGGDDPDFTSGVLAAVTKEGGMPHLWIKHVARCREEAPKRDALIRRITDEDGSTVQVLVENFGAYKDAWAILKKALTGTRIVRGVRMSGDKEVKAAPMEPVFDAGNVHILNAPWNDEWRKQFAAFPDGAHDDDVDATAIAFDHFTRARSGIAVPS